MITKVTPGDYQCWAVLAFYEKPLVLVLKKRFRMDVVPQKLWNLGLSSGPVLENRNLER